MSERRNEWGFPTREPLWLQRLQWALIISSALYVGGVLLRAIGRHGLWTHNSW